MRFCEILGVMERQLMPCYSIRVVAPPMTKCSETVCAMLLPVHTSQTKDSIQGEASLTRSTHVSSVYSSGGAAGEAAATLLITVT